ncbi:hypothetical protein E5F05_17500 [Deinococcus metallilatus]|uniref:Lipoprotein n=1 Tax=Deinococcus metallilatus TaxID=1211322 RepID=A0AAJ5F2A2_9DEIO|nr:DUF6174 domain-containing protein [Deinococcus metallilatus]MBB5296835.1 hypothetical protein [Deinococcus metallilatus]QBY09571.1 hypothetical protein E5F05_17500 [Deinococcus metallilatus]RXJ09175.1 hypothetical protein ERJ73_16335 [Deinococcus metallilatus]TLK22781.1 hypothetical protein FCS05_17150 [Deinococcus metallilatus]GMA13867.1 hypothetical protein GCM10025871_01980 [Deinococcus metallilatus]
MLPLSRLLPPTLLAFVLTACVPAQHLTSAARETAVPLATGCVSGYTRPDFAALERDLAAARAKWKAANVRDYSYDFAQIAAPVLLPTTRVTVRGGTVQGVRLVAGQTGQPSAQARATIEDRFASIAQALAAQKDRPCPAAQAEYDPRDGHPTRFYSGSREADIADGWGEWKITNFTRP